MDEQLGSDLGESFRRIMEGWEKPTDACAPDSHCLLPISTVILHAMEGQGNGQPLILRRLEDALRRVIAECSKGDFLGIGDPELCRRRNMVMWLAIYAVRDVGLALQSGNHRIGEPGLDDLEAELAELEDAVLKFGSTQGMRLRLAEA